MKNKIIFNDAFYKKHPLFTSAAEVQAICQPLFSATNINFFDYIRFYTNNSFVGLVSDRYWIEHFFKSNFILGCTLKNQGAHLWQSYRPQLLLHQAKELFNHDHGISVFIPNKNYIEYFEFAAPRENKEILSIYLNNFEIIERFCKFFTNESKALIKKVMEKPIFINEDMKGELIPEFSVDSSYQNKNSLLLKLSQRERECFDHFTNGKTAKETAKLLGISYRTVEEYFANIKKKSGCPYKRNLLELGRKF